MSSQIKIPSPLRQFTENQSSVSVDGTTVSEVLENIFNQYPEIRNQLLDGNGSIRNFVNIYVNGVDVREKDNLETPEEPPSRMILIFILSYGREELIWILYRLLKRYKNVAFLHRPLSRPPIP